jgi:hypothetical protein
MHVSATLSALCVAILQNFSAVHGQARYQPFSFGYNNVFFMFASCRAHPAFRIAGHEKEGAQGWASKTAKLNSLNAYLTLKPAALRQMKRANQM